MEYLSKVILRPRAVGMYPIDEYNVNAEHISNLQNL